MSRQEFQVSLGNRSLSIWLRATIFCLCAAPLTLAGCGEGQVGGLEGAPEPEHEIQTFANGAFAVGASVEVCKTGSSGLNLRSGAGTTYQILDVLAGGSGATVLSSLGSWVKLDVEGQEGWGYGGYLCAAGSVASNPTDPPASALGAAGCSGAFQHPASGYRVTSEFGSCRDGCSRLHAGIDIGTPLGTSVHTADGGVVEYAGWASGYGYMIDVVHCGKYATRYAHLSKMLVAHGQKIAQGEVIAHSGNTGAGTGPHLHFEIRLGGSGGTAVNPRKYVHF